MSRQALRILMKCEPWKHSFELQQETVQTFHSSCSRILKGSCRLRPLDEALLSIKRNLFSTLFILAAQAAGVARDRLSLYAFVYQCLRAQVTGCDNILDDEFKEVIPFDLSGEGIRFRSVLTIMVADAALSDRILSEVEAGRLTETEGRALTAAVLAVLIPSGLEEHEEEQMDDRTPPTVRDMLNRVHHRKTGLLFEAPVRLVQRMGDGDVHRIDEVATALSQFGIACQILDDLKDVADDHFLGKYNLVISEAWHGNVPTESRLVRAAVRSDQLTLASARATASRLKKASSSCRNRAMRMFMDARTRLHSCLPAFGLKEAAALGILVQNSIMKDRNEILLRETL